MRTKLSFRALKLAAAVLSVHALSDIPAAMAEPGLTSTYSDISKCRTVDEGEDEFVFECKGPGGASALLQYVEGRVGLLFKPAMNGRRIEADDLFELKPNAGKPFPGKLEWRIAPGSIAPCAAIIRVPTKEGEPLLVFNLSIGVLESQAANNKAAHVIADGICADGKRSGQKDRSPRTQTSVLAIADAISKASEEFETAFRETGISGVSELVQNCYVEASSASDVARCAQLDFLGNVNNKIFADRHGMPRYPYFRGHNPQNRMAAAILRLNVPDEQARALQKIFEESI